MKCMVTGGAGFIGSHLVDSLLSKGHEVAVLDSLVSSKKENVPKQVPLLQHDTRKPLDGGEFRDYDTVFHLAADPSVRDSAQRGRENFEINATGTFNILEACRNDGVKNVVFTSTSAVYGEAKVQPTPEDYPTVPISNYAASKIAGEAYCASFAHTYGIKCTALRLANIFGERSAHGVISDFYNKLKKNPKKLEILGDGRQNKSYLYVSDCISAILTAFEKQVENFDIFNVGSEEKHTVDEIAALISKEMGCGPKFEYTGGSKGWVGDVSDMLLDVKKLKNLGWKPETSFGGGVKRYIKWLKSAST